MVHSSCFFSSSTGVATYSTAASASVVLVTAAETDCSVAAALFSTSPVAADSWAAFFSANFSDFSARYATILASLAFKFSSFFTAFGSFRLSQTRVTGPSQVVSMFIY